MRRREEMRRVRSPKDKRRGQGIKDVQVAVSDQYYVIVLTSCGLRPILSSGFNFVRSPANLKLKLLFCPFDLTPGLDD